MATIPSPTLTITKETFRRLVADVKDLIVNPLHSHGIYYLHNDENILKGKALIIGPSETPYEDGFYLFDFTFPANYPHAPPEVKFCTNDGHTRFNPNLYTQGKVCLSILNTWQGEQWTGCQTIASTLLAICSILTNDPLLNEPGVTPLHLDFQKYNNIIKYKNFDTAMLYVLTNEILKTSFVLFRDIMLKHFISHFDKNINRLNELYKLFPEKETIYTNIYHMQVVIDYSRLLAKFHRCKKSLLEAN